jgi:hypothetical protein
MLPALMVHTEWAPAALDGHGLTPETMMNLHVPLHSYFRGIAVHFDREARAVASTGLSEEQWTDHPSPHSRRSPGCRATRSGG